MAKDFRLNQLSRTMRSSHDTNDRSKSFRSFILECNSYERMRSRQILSLDFCA